MEINLKVNNEDYFIKLMILLHNFPPFSKLNRKQLMLYSSLLEYNDKYKTIPLEDRNKIIFSYETRNEIATRFNYKINRIYNLMKGLRDAEVITKEGLIPKYIIPKTKKVTFNFIEDSE